jgi:putative hydroxymethylpyrimidine transport system substrate-binding protein
VRAASAAAAALAAALLTAGCGEKSDVLTASPALAQPVSIVLDAAPDAADVGLYEAAADGDFRRAGLDVSIRTAPAGSTALAQLDAGRDEIALAGEPELMQARGQGELLVGIGAVAQQPLEAIVSLGAKQITTPADLRGQRVGDDGTPLARALLAKVLAQAGVAASTVDELTVTGGLAAALRANRADAVLGATWNVDAVALKQARRRPNVIQLQDAGVPDFEGLVLVTRETTLANRNNVLRRFVQALARGYASVRADPQAGIAALERANPALSPRLASASVRATLPALFPQNASLPWGWQSTPQWNAFGRWMLSANLIGGLRAVAEASTNQLLAGQGP